MSLNRCCETGKRFSVGRRLKGGDRVSTPLVFLLLASLSVVCSGGIGAQTPPSLSCNDVTLGTDPGQCSRLIQESDLLPSISVSGDPLPTLSYDPPMGTVLQVGDTTIRVTAINSEGQTSCDLVVSVTDTETPVARCRNGVVVELAAGTNEGILLPQELDGGSSDNCGIASMTVTPNTFNCTHVGTQTVTLKVVDGAGNQDTCTTTVTVRDTVPPNARCKSLTISVPPGGTKQVFARDLNNRSSDNCTRVNALVFEIQDPNTGSYVPSLTFDCTDVGTHSVTLRVTDGSGNTAECSATITVRVNDNEPPAMVCRDVSVPLDPVTGLATITPSMLDGGSSDNCGIKELTINETSFDCTRIGANFVTLTGTDYNGNVASCTAIVSVDPCPVGSTDEVVVLDTPLTADMTINDTRTYVVSLPTGTSVLVPKGITLEVRSAARFVVKPNLTLTENNERNVDVFGRILLDSPGDPIVFSGCAGFDCADLNWGALRIFADETQPPSVIRNVVFRQAGRRNSRRAAGNPGSGIRAMTTNPTNHVIRLSSRPHVVENVSFEDCLGAPILVEPPLVQQIGNVTLPPDYGTDPPNTIRALAISDIRGNDITSVTDGITILSPLTNDLESYYFPISIQFLPDSTLRVEPGTRILMGPNKWIRCLGTAEFVGTAAQNIRIEPLLADTQWSRLELVGSSPQRVAGVRFIRSGVPAPLPLFDGTGTPRTFVGTGTLLTPGCTLLMSEANHIVQDVTLESWQQLVFAQDLRISPSYGGTIYVGMPASATQPWLDAIGLYDFTLGKENYPLVIDRDTTLSPPRTGEFVFDTPSLKGTGIHQSPNFFIDRDLIVPRNFKLTLDSGDPAGNQRLKLLFSKQEAAATEVVTNLQGGKCELAVLGSLETLVKELNPVLLSSTEYRTPSFFEQIPEETDLNETDFKRRKFGGKTNLEKLLDDIETTYETMRRDPPSKRAFRKTLPQPERSLDWAGVFLTNDSDDLETVLQYAEIRNAINGVTFLTASSTIRNCVITNCFGTAVACLDRSFPLIEQNEIRGNGLGGILCLFGSSPEIRGNRIIDNTNGTGVHIGEFSNPILGGNTITGNNIGVFIDTGSFPSLGRADSPDPGAPDSGGNEIFENNNTLGFIANVVNNTPNRIYAQNNRWGVSDPDRIDKTIIDDDEAGTVPGLIPNPGPVEFLPLFSALTATPTDPGPTATATFTPTETPTRDPSLPTPLPTATLTPTVTPVEIATPSPTPTPLPPALDKLVAADLQASGVVRLTTDVTVLSGVTLTFMPGTKIVATGNYGITVQENASIQAVGTEPDPIFFISEPDTPWKGITLLGPTGVDETRPSRFEYCIFQRANPSALGFLNVRTVVENCTFRDCFAGVFVTGGYQTRPRLRRNTFLDNSFSSAVIALSGDVPVGTQPEDIFNLGIGRLDPTDNRNVDPGFNTFIQPSTTAPGSDILVQSFLTGQILRADENVFLTESPEGDNVLVDEAELLATGRVGGISPPATLAAPPILTNVTSTEDGVLRIVDDELWGGVVVMDPANRIVEVAEGVELTILPGTRIYFFPDSDSVAGVRTTLRVRGRLKALGTPRKKIRFGSANEVIPGADPTEFDWGGLEMVADENEESAPSEIRFAEIRHAAVGVTVYAGDRTVLRNTLIENCGEACVIVSDLTPPDSPDFVLSQSVEKAVTSSDTLNRRGVVKGMSFLRTEPILEGLFLLGDTYGEFGLHSINSSPWVRGCAIGIDPRRNDFPLRGFRRAGVLVEGFRVPEMGTQDDFGNNLIAGSADVHSGKYEVIHSSAQTMNAVGNYWLASSKEGAEEKILDAAENAEAGDVVVDPILLRPPALDQPGGDLDSDSLFLANDFTAFMRGIASGTLPSDERYRAFIDRDGNHVIDHRDVFLFALTYNEKSTRPILELPATPTETATPFPTGTVPATPTPTETPVGPTPTEVQVGTGDVQVTLEWDSDADLDLHLIEPSGFEISWANPVSPTGGTFQNDDRGACAGLPGGGPENIYWETGTAPAGTYSFYVIYGASDSDTCSITETNWFVAVRLDGEIVQVVPGTLRQPGEESSRSEFTYGIQPTATPTPEAGGVCTGGTYNGSYQGDGLNLGMSVDISSDGEFVTGFSINRYRSCSDTTLETGNWAYIGDSRKQITGGRFGPVSETFTEDGITGTFTFSGSCISDTSLSGTWELQYSGNETCFFSGTWSANR